MDAKEKNKLKCKAYYERTKNNLSDEVKAKRKAQSHIRQQRYYEKNRELCIQRSRESRSRKPKKVKVEIEKVTKQIILNQKPLKVKKINTKIVSEVLRKNPKCKLWDINITEWKRKHYLEFENLRTQSNYLQSI